VELSLSNQLQWIADSSFKILPELSLCSGIVFILILNLIRIHRHLAYIIVSTATVFLSGIIILVQWPTEPVSLFHSMLSVDSFSATFKILFLTGVLITFCLSGWTRTISNPSEYYVLLLSVTLGAHLLVMSTHLIMVLLSLELISLSSYALTGFHFSKQSAEGSLKYFLFGSATTAVMIYGMSMLFGLTGTLQFNSQEFTEKLIGIQSPFFLVASFFILAGFLFKASAAPFHLWAPDVYESAPLPIVAFFSVVPKLAGVAALLKFSLAINLYGQSYFDWQSILACIAILSIVIGNLSALWQKDARRMMAYSSIAQAGFLIAAIAPLQLQSMQFFIFYAVVFLIMNFALFISLQQFEINYQTTIIDQLSGLGKKNLVASIVAFFSLIALAGLPPTSGFTGKLFVFSALWESYSQTGKSALLWLFIIGLVNTVISLFFYLKLPFYLFIKNNLLPDHSQSKSFTLANLLGLILVVVLFVLFFYPGLLMGLANRINFVL